MTDDRRKQLSRRAVLKGGVVLLAGLAAIPVVAAEAGKAPKAAMQYQDKPKGDQQCSNCSHFIPGSSPTAMGQCTVVAGDISPHGWCVAYAKKP